jgi:hypothetical protein
VDGFFTMKLPWTMYSSRITQGFTPSVIDFSLCGCCACSPDLHPGHEAPFFVTASLSPALTKQTTCYHHCLHPSAAIITPPAPHPPTPTHSHLQSADAELLEEEGPRRKWRLDYRAHWHFWKVAGVCKNK